MLVAGIGAYAVFEAGINELNHSVTTADLGLGPSSKPKLNGSTIAGPINILMVGVDATGHTDSIMIAHFPASHNEVYFISLPRDTQVNVPTGGTNKINAVYDSGKMPLLQQTIKNNYGITVNAGLIVNFSGFDKIVTKLGGIDMYVDETTYSIHHGYINNNPADHYTVGYGYPYKIDPNSGVPICSIRGVAWGPKTADECTIPGVKEVVYQKGPHHFDAYAALDFVRCRDGLVGTDYARQRHQQQFIKAVMDKVYAKGLSDPLSMLGLIQSMNQAFTLDANGVPLEDWLFTLDKITPSNMITIKTNDGQFVNPTGPPDGHGSEQGLNADTMDLLGRVAHDDGSGDPVGAFLAIHPDWAANT